MFKGTFHNKRMTLTVLLAMLLALFVSSPTKAQTQQPAPETKAVVASEPEQSEQNVQEQESVDEDKSTNEEDVKDLVLYKKQVIAPNTIKSLLFTKWEYDAILDAIRAIGKTDVRLPTTGELGQSEKDIDEARYRKPPPPEERYLSLSGLIYHSKKDWTLWLNGERVTPEAIPKEIVDLRVYKDYIEVKWYDEYSRTVYPVKLRPHQRFNLDTRIFLPG